MAVSRKMAWPRRRANAVSTDAADHRPNCPQSPAAASGVCGRGGGGFGGGGILVGAGVFGWPTCDQTWASCWQSSVFRSRTQACVNRDHSDHASRMVRAS